MTLVGHGEKVLNMKIFLTFLILIFSLQSWTKADNISEFEIEGLSVGESLTEYLDYNEIKKRIKHKTSFHYPNSKFVSINYKSENLNLFDSLGVVLKKDDPKFIIYAVEATIYFWENKIDKCYQKQKQIKKDLKIFFGNKVKIETYDTKYVGDKTGNSMTKYVDFDFNDQSNSRIICYDLSDEINLKSPDQLYLVANSREFMIFLNENM